MSITPYISEAQELFSDLPSDLTLKEAVPVLARLAREHAFLDSYVLHLLEQAEQGKEWHLDYCCGGKNGSYSLQVFVWPPGSKTQIHDYSCWGAFCCVSGCQLEERYERLDCGCQPNHARLRKVWRRVGQQEDGTSTLLPYEAGIHRVGNPAESKAISVHLYGPHIGEVDGRDYDPSRDYVCDRREV